MTAQRPVTEWIVFAPEEVCPNDIAREALALQLEARYPGHRFCVDERNPFGDGLAVIPVCGYGGDKGDEITMLEQPSRATVREITEAARILAPRAALALN